MNRSLYGFAGAVVALAAVAGVAAVAAPGDDDATDATSAASAQRKPVERSTLVCAKPSASDVAETTWTAFVPKGAPGKKGSAELRPAELADPDGGTGGTDDGNGKGKGEKDGKDGKGKKRDKGRSEDAAKKRSKDDDKPVVPLSAPGTPVTSTADSSEAPALTGSADGRFAPGWTVQQTTTVSAGAGRGLQGASCTTPDTTFWFPAVSTAKERQDYVHLTNPDSTSAVVDLEMHGKGGKEKAPSGAGEGITVPPRSTVPVLLSTLTAEPVTNAALHVVARNGRVGAQVNAADEKLGGDWIAPAGDPGPRAVLPGIPGDATSVRLVAFTPGGKDADLKVRLAGPTGEISPAGHETLHVKAGMTTAVDLKELTKGDPGSLVLSPAEDKAEAPPVVAAVRVTRGKGARQETAFIPSTPAVEKRATVAENGARGTELALTATDKDAKIKVTSSAGSGGGSPKSTTVTVKAHTTKSLAPPRPQGGKGTYAVTVERLSGGPVHASRTLTRKQDGIPAFTVQTLPDDRSTVVVPDAAEDLSVLTED
ncbi:DUF5719 family protein [Streptomyces sp. NPDC048172]|uniref:DUF5719 family protein n=1 Tax=Streptomyces sp. NPDC048172 TaxID=3365505 RepID=UPI0037123414